MLTGVLRKIDKLFKERFDITFIKYKKSCYNINFFFIKYFLKWFIKKCY